MAHHVIRRGKYHSIEESYRENGKVRKRVLRYLGTRRSDDPQARMQQMLDTAESKGQEIDEAQRAKYGETASERQERAREEAAFSQQSFLDSTALADPAPAEPAEAKEEGPADAAEPGDPTPV